jgi:hypothetical protein
VLPAGDGRVRKWLGIAGIFLGIAWAASDVLAPLSLYYGYFQGSLASYQNDLQPFLSFNEWRVLTAPASAAVALVGYRVAKGRSPSRPVIVAIVLLYGGGFSVHSILTAMMTPFFLGPNLYVLQGAFLAACGTLFILYGRRGFKLAGFLLAEMGVFLYYIGGLTLPPGFADYGWMTVVSTDFAKFHIIEDQFRLWVFFTQDVAPAFLAVVGVALAAGAMRAYASKREGVVHRIGDFLLFVCGSAFGLILIIVSCFGGAMFGALLVYYVNTLGLGAASPFVPILAAGPIVSAVQALGGVSVIMAALPRRSGTSWRWGPPLDWAAGSDEGQSGTDNNPSRL